MEYTTAQLGKMHPKEFNAWRNLRQRCTNPNTEHFNRYGGRGITFCDRWKSFENFLDDMGEAPSPKHSIDRIDNDGNYCPENCRWVTQHEQLLNSTKSFGAKVHESEVPLAKVSRTTIYRRIAKGWDKDKALNHAPIRNHKAVECVESGEKYESIASAARTLEVSEERIRYVVKHPHASVKGKHFKFV